MKKKGITLIETVVSMLLVGILTVVALSLALASSNAQERSVEKFLYVNQTENVLTCYLNADKQESNVIKQQTFEKGLTDLFSDNCYELVEENNDLTYVLYFNADLKIATYNKFKYKLNVNIDNFNSINIQVSKNNNDNLKKVFETKFNS